MKVTLITHTPDPEKVVAAAAKLCYSKSSITDLMDGLSDEKTAAFLNKLSNLGHASPLEHVSFTFGIEGVSRSFLAQMTRHRIASFSVQSQRYVDMSAADMVVPPAIAQDGEASEAFSQAIKSAKYSYDHLHHVLEDIHTYELMLGDSNMTEKQARAKASKMANEDARFVLPEACQTRMLVTMNARELNNFFKLRCCCYDDKTEVLTKDGWKLFKDLTDGDVFYSLNTETLEAEYVNANRRFEYDYDGDMYEVDAQSVNLKITPNHNVLCSTSYENKKWMLEEIQNVADAKRVLMKKNCVPISGKKEEYFRLNDLVIQRANQFGGYDVTLNGYSIPTNDFMRILGFYLSDGYAVHSGDHYFIGFSKGDKKLLEEYKVILDEFVAGKTRIIKDRSSWKLEVEDRQLYEFFSPFGNCYKKRIPSYVWDYDFSHLSYLYKGFWDGDFNKAGNAIFTASEKMADDLQRLFLHLGVSATKSVCDRIGRRSCGVDADGNPYDITTRSIQYIVTVNRAKNEPIVKSNTHNNFKITHYDGKVYCVELEKNHTLYVRRNGRTVWSGNSRAQWEIRQVADEMLKLVYPIAPHLFKDAGPGCLAGKGCTEGSMTCGLMAQVQDKYKNIKEALI